MKTTFGNTPAEKGIQEAQKQAYYMRMDTNDIIKEYRKIYTRTDADCANRVLQYIADLKNESLTRALAKAEARLLGSYRDITISKK